MLSSALSKSSPCPSMKSRPAKETKFDSGHSHTSTKIAKTRTKLTHGKQIRMSAVTEDTNYNRAIPRRVSISFTAGYLRRTYSRLVKSHYQALSQVHQLLDLFIRRLSDIALLFSNFSGIVWVSYELCVSFFHPKKLRLSPPPMCAMCTLHCFTMT